MAEQKSLEGWIPALDETLSIEQVIELAFDYRGNTTIVKTDGSSIEGYIFNRYSDVREPFLEYFDTSGAGPFVLRYSEIANVNFSGKDTAVGKSWEAWQRRKTEAKARAARGKPRKGVQRASGVDRHAEGGILLRQDDPRFASERSWATVEGRYRGDGGPYLDRRHRCTGDGEGGLGADSGARGDGDTGTGIRGGSIAGSEPGDLVLGTETCMVEDSSLGETRSTAVLDAALLAKAESALSRSGIRYHVGKIGTVSRVATEPEVKVRLGKRLGVWPWTWRHITWRRPSHDTVSPSLQSGPYWTPSKCGSPRGSTPCTRMAGSPLNGSSPSLGDIPESCGGCRVSGSRPGRRTGHSTGSSGAFSLSTEPADGIFKEPRAF